MIFPNHGASYVPEHCLKVVHICFAAYQCTHDVDCAATDGTVCIADYCQPEFCTATGQCVAGQECSQKINHKTCVCKAYEYLPWKYLKQKR